MQKLPPIEKVYEAYSAIADNRVTLFEGYSVVLSSNGAKNYTVLWDETTYYSNDNATYWQGYAGYPVIAVLMLQGKLPLNMDIANMFADINWTEINAAAKRDYAKAVDEIFSQRQYDTDTKNKARAEAASVHEALTKLNIEIKRAPKRLPSGSAGSKE